jgi:ABC-type nitrate/sulfonate/bicarbonate transport system substrate-binding protein
MTTKQVDKQGRLVLGARYANQTMIIDDSDETRIVITPAKVVPAHEAWLYNNPEAMKSVLLGLQQARNGEVADGVPNIDADWIDQLED